MGRLFGENYAFLAIETDASNLAAGDVTEIEGTDVTLATPAGEERIGIDDVFVFIGGELPFPLLQRIGIRFGGDDATPDNR